MLEIMGFGCIECSSPINEFTNLRKHFRLFKRVQLILTRIISITVSFAPILKEQDAESWNSIDSHELTKTAWLCFWLGYSCSKLEMHASHITANADKPMILS